MGDRYISPAEVWNYVISVSHFSLGICVWKSLWIRFSGVGLISPS